MQRSRKATLRAVEARVKLIDFHVWPDVPRITCLVVLENGFSITANYLSTSRNPHEYDEKSAKRKAYHNALERLLQLESYLQADADWRFSQRLANRDMFETLLGSAAQ